MLEFGSCVGAAMDYETNFRPNYMSCVDSNSKWISSYLVFELAFGSLVWWFSKLVSDLDLGSKWFTKLRFGSVLLLDLRSGSLVLIVEVSFAICKVYNTLGRLRFLGVWITSLRCW